MKRTTKSSNHPGTGTGIADTFAGSKLLIIYGGVLLLIIGWAIGLPVAGTFGETILIAFATFMTLISVVYVFLFFLGKRMRVTLGASFVIFGLLWGIAAVSPESEVPTGIAGPGNSRIIIDVVDIREIPQPRSIDIHVPNLSPLPPGVAADGFIIPVNDDETDIVTMRENPGVPYDTRFDNAIIELGQPDTKDPSKEYKYIEYSVPPTALKLERPKYPEIASSMGIEGDVILLVYIDETGAVKNAIVQSSPGLPAMEDAALKAAYGCQFAPAMQQGTPVGVWYSIVMSFDK